jgi:tetratricopeptide (TPR) repeat protein
VLGLARRADTLPAAFGQAPGASDKAGAYYNFAMGHYYAEQSAGSGNRGDYYTKAVDYYKQALKLDPSASFLLEELTDLYVQGNQLKSAVAEAEEILKQNPDNLAARRMLGRIYTRSIGDAQQGKINEDMVRKSIEQYQIITSKDPSDIESWLTLGRLQRVVDQYFNALRQGDTQTLTSFSLVQLDQKVDSWKITGSTPANLYSEIEQVHYEQLQRIRPRTVLTVVALVTTTVDAASRSHAPGGL